MDWSDLNRSVSERVETALASGAPTHAPLILSLRELEAMARRDFDRHDTIQVLESGRRLLGDTSGSAPALSRTPKGRRKP